MTDREEAQSNTLIEWLLGAFTKVRPGEGNTALLMALNIFFVLTCYYILKPAREAFMSLEDQGAQLASYASGFMAVLLIPTVYFYGKLTERFVRRRLIAVVNGFFIANLVLFYFLAENQTPWLGLIFFVWVGIFNNMVVAQFWAYANDIYTPEQGKRLFPLIVVGQNVGAVLGTRVADATLEWTGSSSLMPPAAAVFLAVSIFLTFRIDSRQSAQSPLQRQKETAEETLGAEGGFQLILKHRYLALIALLILVLNLVNTTGEYILRNSVYAAAADAQVSRDVFAGSYYADFFLWVNILTMAIQAFLVSRILKYIGVRGALFILPAIAFIGYGAITVLPILALITVIKMVENSTDYSLMNTLRAALYLPTSREAKYKAKQAIDTFVVRTGDVISALLVFVGFQVLGFATRGFSAIVFGIVIIWIILALAIVREHKKLLPEE